MWRDSGICAQTDPEEFFPAKGGDPKPAKAGLAGVTICDACRAAERSRRGWGAA